MCCAELKRGVIAAPKLGEKRRRSFVGINVYQDVSVVDIMIPLKCEAGISEV